MSCPLDLETLAALRDGRPAAGLRSHLAAPCDQCLSLLETVDPLAEVELAPARDAMFRAAWDRRPLSAGESDDMFAAAWSRRAGEGAAATASLGAVVPLFRRPAVRAAMALAAMLVAVLGASVLLRPAAPAWDGLKGRPAPRPSLSLFIGAADGTVRPGDRPGPGDRVLVRYRVEAPAVVYLWAEKGGEVEALVSGEQMTAGERELTRGGAALGLDLEGGAVTLAACERALEGLEPRNAAQRCAVDRREIHAP